MKLALTTDHAGFELLKQLKTYLESAGHECVDYGPKEYDESDDYPLLISPAAQAVAAGECEMGIIMGGSGQGEAMAANRVRGVRCAVYYGPAAPVGSIDAEGRGASDDKEIIRLSRQHNNANILSLAARFLTIEDMQKAVTLWLSTPFEGVERHARRTAQLDNV
jgi:ribose 5-phosphate isomerase B